MKFKQLVATASWLLVCRDSSRMVRQLLRDMINAGAKPLLWTEKVAADEASMPLTVYDQFLSQSPDDAPAANANSIMIHTKQASISKILQTNREYSCLFRQSDGTYANVTWEVPVPLQIMSRCKADVYFDCFMKSGHPLRFDHIAMLNMLSARCNFSFSRSGHSRFCCGHCCLPALTAQFRHCNSENKLPLVLRSAA